ncbi:type IV pilus biogenesis/stability protein PilW [sulfur-oxidizing endosymbiont of Gigantopelta aegis]|uniref:type IV pilus biogenesis/stability protein PilW n=1 Tax=sulfur-oxidizing endosymbiont of Gigantopelta aegis TaxID=2794934 RepID=UPI0018DD79B4|nr:type IV pilus biogenesis/stability protein PilW [sulfur-oxidizing endosymbiont of Gigantopelta aegis]
MKKLFIVLLSLGALSACQNSPLSDSTAGDDDLSVRYSESSSGEGGNKASEINTQLGAGYIGNGNYERALIKLNKALEFDANNAQAHNYLGVLYGRLERPDKAESSFNKALRIAPNNSSILNNYAIFLCEQKNYEKARVMFKRVLNNPLYTNLDQAYQSAGFCALSNNNWDLAEKLYRKSLDLTANSALALLGLAKVNYKKQNFQYAWSYFERYYKVSVLDSDALWLGINILEEVSKPDKNLLSSFKLQLKSKYPDSDETKWFYEGKQEY